VLLQHSLPLQACSSWGVASGPAAVGGANASHWYCTDELGGRCSATVLHSGEGELTDSGGLLRGKAALTAEACRRAMCFRQGRAGANLLHMFGRGGLQVGSRFLVKWDLGSGCPGGA
jgi:hypothetical protein